MFDFIKATFGLVYIPYSIVKLLISKDFYRIRHLLPHLVSIFWLPIIAYYNILILQNANLWYSILAIVILSPLLITTASFIKRVFNFRENPLKEDFIDLIKAETKLTIT